MKRAAIRRPRRRTVGLSLGLGLVLSPMAPVLQAAPAPDVTGAVNVRSVVGEQVPVLVAGETPRDIAGRARSQTRLQHLRMVTAASEAIADRWASVPVPSDPAAALALRARVLFDRSDAGDTEAWEQYRNVRRRIATDIAGRLGLPVAELRAAWRDAPVAHQRALMAALSQLGVPYRSMASREWQGFDCSGLTSFAWSQAGLVIPRSSGTQIAAAASRTIDDAQAGDLVYYPGHVSMYLGVENAIVHSPYPGRDVEVDRVDRRVRFGDPTA